MPAWRCRLRHVPADRTHPLGARIQLPQQTRIDQKREKVRIGYKKAEPTRLTPDQAAALKDQPGTPQGRRDRFLLCLLLDHGLRVGEVAALSRSDFDVTSKELRFFRPKVNKEQVHH